MRLLWDGYGFGLTNNRKKYKIILIKKLQVQHTEKDEQYGGEYMVRWLQISDLHIKKRADWRSFERELVGKCEELGDIAFVVVTGDFHDFSEGPAFHQSREFLINLMRQLRLNIEEDLFLIPGNHDGVTCIENKRIHIKALREDPLDGDAPKSFEALEGAFEDYDKFVTELIPNYPVEHPAACHVRCWKNKINFIHCNTAIGADGKSKDRQMLNVDELAELTIEKGRTNIILAHNSFADMDGEVQKRIRDYIRVNDVVAYFCGDRHRQEVASIEIDKKRNVQIPCVVNYKSAPDAEDHYSEFGIIIGEWSGQRAKLQGWIWKSGEGFEIDGKITGTEISMHSQEVEIQKTEMIKNDYAEKVKNQDKELMHRFSMDYHRLTPHMIVQYNAAYQKSGWGIKESYTEKELFQYIAAAKEAGKLEELTDFVKSLA